ncbi:hypothetical protein LHJ74_22740 [Streptomyces sp. N2-109]|uniref:PPOX class F420-dependent oxidoreductase n=1 Tax=Streptomyces gossypii TaxID=2883101 RepID=A0ABT2JXR6_9ACTN|nr:pyridoxamine 5'-phosphate oxidase family protein [Streptomyces gossypii]MCT2592694.1 hypothetical protein [Streptomyces gossypii]
MATPTTGLHVLSRRGRVRLTTYEPDGRPVGSSACIVVEGDHAFVRTYRKAKHAERLRRYPEAELAPADLGGTPIGAPMKARARRLEGSEARRAAAKLARKHPLLQGVAAPLGSALRLDRPVHYELRLVGE